MNMFKKYLISKSYSDTIPSYEPDLFRRIPQGLHLKHTTNKFNRSQKRCEYLYHPPF